MSTTSPILATPELRAQFPSLRDGRIYLDGPGGTQVHQSVYDAVAGYWRDRNANLGGPFETSRLSDATLQSARDTVAGFLGAATGNEIAFGANMTTLTFHASRTLLRDCGPGDEVLVTGLDHDANVSPWMLAAADRGMTVRVADIDTEACLVDLDDFAAKLSDRTKVAAFGWASNGAGTVNDVRRMSELARQAGALSYIDAVHFAPHGEIDVGAVGCDFLVCSAYKFFGPHVGILFGRRELLERYRPYKVRPASDDVPGSWETGTVNLEGIAGTAAAVAYLESVGMENVTAYEHTLAERLIGGLDAIDGVSAYGTRDLSRRVPTATFNVAGHAPAAVAAALGEQGIYVWDGNYYALELMQRLGLEDSGGAVRVGAAHYTTPEEIDRFLEAVASL